MSFVIPRKKTWLTVKELKQFAAEFPVQASDFINDIGCRLAGASGSRGAAAAFAAGDYSRRLTAIGGTAVGLAQLRPYAV